MGWGAYFEIEAENAKAHRDKAMKSSPKQDRDVENDGLD